MRSIQTSQANQTSQSSTTSKSTIGHRIRVALVASALVVTLGGSAQSVFAGPVAPPPGKSSVKTCVKKGKLGIKTTKGCVVKLGPVAPPPGM